MFRTVLPPQRSAQREAVFKRAGVPGRFSGWGNATPWGFESLSGQICFARYCHHSAARSAKRFSTVRGPRPLQRLGQCNTVGVRVPFWGHVSHGVATTAQRAARSGFQPCGVPGRFSGWGNATPWGFESLSGQICFARCCHHSAALSAKRFSTVRGSPAALAAGAMQHRKVSGVLVGRRLDRTCEMMRGIVESGLARAVTAGEEVTLRSGTTATVRRSYPRGYRGSVDILLAGSQETESAASLTLARGTGRGQGRLG